METLTPSLTIVIISVLISAGFLLAYIVKQERKLRAVKDKAELLNVLLDF